MNDPGGDALATNWDAVYVAALLCECVYKIAEAGSGEAFLGALRHTLAQAGALPGDRLAGETLRVLPSRRDVPQRYVLAECTAVPGLVFCCFMGTKTIADVRVNVDIGVRGRRHTLLWQRALGVLPTIRTLRQYHCALGGRRLVLCGHSLGGMLAQIVVLLLGEEAQADVGLLTFGSPGVLGLVDVGVSGDWSMCAIPRTNVVARNDLIVRGAQRVLVENKSNYVGRLLEVEFPWDWSIHGVHGHGMRGYRRLVGLFRAREREGMNRESEGGASATVTKTPSVTTSIDQSNPPSVVRGDQGLVPQVSVQRVDVRVGDGLEGASSATVSAHGRWIGMGRWTGVDWRLQAAIYEDDFRDGVRRFPFKFCKL